MRMVVYPYLLSILLCVLACNSCTYSKTLTNGHLLQVQADTINDLKVHKRNSLEWWYFSSHLKDSIGYDFGVMFTVFKKHIPILGNYIMVNAMVTDEKKHQFYKFYDFQKYKKRSYRDSSMVIKGGNHKSTWSIERVQNNLWVYNFESKHYVFSKIHLQMRGSKPMIAEAKNGYMHYKGIGEAGYLSNTNMATSGSIKINGKSINMIGKSWFDKQWNCASITKRNTSWNWMGIQFDDNEELMFFKTINKRSDITDCQATYIDVNGVAKYISKEDIVLAPNNYYMAPSLNLYTTTWYFEIKSMNIHGTISPNFNDHEMQLKLLGREMMTYWEGKCNVIAYKKNKLILGQAFLEMTRPN